MGLAGHTTLKFTHYSGYHGDEKHEWALYK